MLQKYNATISVGLFMDNFLILGTFNCSNFAKNTQFLMTSSTLLWVDFEV